MKWGLGMRAIYNALGRDLHLASHGFPPGSAGVPPAFCPGQRFRPCQRLRTRVQTGNILYTINRKHGLHLAKISGKEPGSPLKITPPWRGSRRDRGGARGRAGGAPPPGSEAR